MKEFFLRFKPFLLDYKKEFVFVILAIIVIAVTSSLTAYLVQPVLDEIFIKKDREMLYYLPYFIILLYSLKGLGRFTQTYYTNHIGQDIVRRVRDLMLSSMFKFDLEFFNQNRNGELISRVTNDINRIQVAVSNYIAEFVRETLTIVALVAVVIYQSPKLAFFGLIVMPLAIYPITRFAKRVKKLSYKSQSKISDLTSKLNEIFNNIEIIKANSSEKIESKEFAKENLEFFQINMKSVKVSELVSPFMEFIGSIAIASVIIIGGIEVIEDKITVGAFFSFMTALFMLYTPIKKVSNIYGKMQDGIAASERIFELINLKPSIISGDKKLNNIDSIEFKNISLNYGETEALKDIDLIAKKGDIFALVGDSGGGKSSLINLIVRFYDVSSGELLINNQNIKEFDISSLRDRIAIVTQRVFIFNDSVAKNISYSQAFDEERVIDALKQAKAYEFVSKLKDGIYTKLDEFGVNLSGGQRQRIAIARAIYKNPDIFIFDEATSALDNESEAYIQNSLKEITKDKITFIIAHRLNSIKFAKEVLLFKDGKIIAKGDEERLLKTSKEFEKLSSV